MKEIIKNQLVQDGWQKGDKLLLAISGGVDSMLMWRLIHELELEYAVAHVNFQLRGSDSNADQSLIEKVARVRNTRCFILQENASDFAKKQGLSIQMAAREIRYKWFEKVMQDNKFEFLCTAHHLNDSIETFFINLDRGTGIKGLAGISSTQRILRPLISLTKQEIRYCAEQLQLSYREDKTNLENKYKRNWLRNTILNNWQENNPSFEKTMAKNIARLNKTEKVFKKAISKDLAQIRSELEKDYFLIQSFQDLEFPEESLFELLTEYGFNETQIQNLNTGIQNHQVGLRLTSDNFELNLDREKVYLKAQKEKEQSLETQIFKYQDEIDSPIPLSFQVITKSEMLLDSDPNIEHVDMDKLNFPLKIRQWRKGDKMQPLGMKGQKKVSDILVDSKVPLIEKENCLLIESDQQIVWLIGYRVSEQFKVDKQTKQVLKMKRLK